MRLEHSSWLQVERYFKDHDLVILPIGSTENHGSHMALGTDMLVPDYIAGELDKQLDVLITPVMPFGAADHHYRQPKQNHPFHEAFLLPACSFPSVLFSSANPLSFIGIIISAYLLLRKLIIGESLFLCSVILKKHW